MRTVKIQIKTDEVSKDTKNHLKFKKKLRKLLMQREENRKSSFDIDKTFETFREFDPLLDWSFAPVCGCEIKGMEKDFYNLKHNKLFGKNGHLLHEECISDSGGTTYASEGYELWLLEDLSLVFTYYCMFWDAKTKSGMIYRYPLGKRIPTKMDLETHSFLTGLSYEILRKRVSKLR